MRLARLVRALDSFITMEYLVGVSLAIALCGLAALLGFDRDRVFYPTMLIVIASYYALFAVMGATTSVLVIESIVAGVFLLIAAIGFKTNLWLIVAALAGHGVFDFTHHVFFENPGVPVWWPGFCLAFDVAAAGFLSVLLVKRSGHHA